MSLALARFVTLAFSMSGGLAGVRADLDVFWVCVLAAVVGLAGGICAQVLLGLRVETLSDWRFLTAVGVGGGRREPPRLSARRV
jgi:uncharacterized membrane protein YeiH